MIQDALRSLPARPAMLIAPLLIIGGLALYYADTWRQCTRDADLRARLHQAAAAAGEGSGPLRLAEVAAFDWARVGIFPNHDPGTGKNVDCPFGWGWSDDERQEAVVQGLLTLLVFTKNSELRGTIEIRGDRVDFRDIDNPYTRETAVFEVRRTKTGGAPLVAHPAAR